MADLLSFGITASFDPTGVNAAAAGVQKVGTAAAEVAVQAQKVVPALTSLATSGAGAGRTVAAATAQAATALNTEASAAKAAEGALASAGNAGKKAGADTAAAYEAATAKVQAAVDKMRQATAAPAGGGVAGGLAQGVGLSVGLAAIEQAREALAALQGAVSEGVKFNATVESSQLGVAAILRQFDPVKFSSVGSAMAVAGDVIEDLKVKATETTASFSDLVQAFTANAGAATAAGVPIEKQASLLITLSNAVAGLGLEQRQLAQEARSLLSGQIDENAAVARAVGITREQIEAAKAQGKVYEFLTGKLAAFQEAGALASDTLQGLQSNLGDFREQLAGELTKPLFDVEKTGLRDLQDALKDPAVSESAAILGQALADAADAARVLSTSAVPALAAIAAGAVATLSPLAGITAEINRSTDAEEKYGRAYANANRDIQTQLQLAKTDVQQNAVRARVAKEILETEQRLTTLQNARNRLFNGAEQEQAQQQLTTLKGIESTLERTIGKQVKLKGEVQLTKEAVEKEKVAREAVAVSLEKSLSDARELVLADEKRIKGLNDALDAFRPLSEQQALATTASEKQLATLRSMAGAAGLQVGPLERVAQIQDDINRLDESRRAPLLEQLRIYAEALERQQKITTEIGNQTTAADALAKKLKAANDALPVDGSQATADARAPLTAALNRVPATNAAGASGAFPAETANLLATLIAALAGNGARPSVFPTPGAPGNVPTPAGSPFPDPAGASGYGDSAATRPAAAPDVSAATQPVATAAEGLKTALADGLKPAKDALDVAAGAVPAQVAPVATAVGKLSDAQGKAYTDLAGTVDVLAGQVNQLTAINTALAVRVAQQQRDISILQTLV